MLAVEDHEGGTAYLKLFNYAMLSNATEGDRESVFPIGSILIIREPTYVDNSNVPELPFIRVDTPSDIVFIDPDHSILRDISWKTYMTTSGRPSSGEAWRAMGLKSFKAQQWYACAIAFTNCIKLEYDVELSRLNRSEAYLRLGWHHSALHDSKGALGTGTLSDDLKRKAVVRIIKAQYAMNQYSAILETAKALPEDAAVVEWTARATQRIEEQSTGKYDWDKFFVESSRKPLDPLDIADFTGPLEVKTGTTGLRGTFVTRDVKVGELLVSDFPVR